MIEKVMWSYLEIVIGKIKNLQNNSSCRNFVVIVSALDFFVFFN